MSSIYFLWDCKHFSGLINRTLAFAEIICLPSDKEEVLMDSYLYCLSGREVSPILQKLCTRLSQSTNAELNATRGKCQHSFLAGLQLKVTGGDIQVH